MTCIQNVSEETCDDTNCNANKHRLLKCCVMCVLSNTVVKNTHGNAVCCQFFFLLFKGNDPPPHPDMFEGISKQILCVHYSYSIEKLPFEDANVIPVKCFHSRSILSASRGSMFDVMLVYDAYLIHLHCSLPVCKTGV